MSSTKITLDPSFRPTGDAMTVSCEAKPMTFNLDPSALGKLPAEAIAKRIQDQMRGLKSWNKTGTLINGIKAVQNGEDWDIVAPPDRLKRDPELLVKLREQVFVLSQPLVDPIVKATVGKTAEQVVEGGRR